MKKIVMSVVLVATLSAAENVAASMKEMRDGLVQVQDGFLYNSKTSILDGIKKIKTANAVFHDEKSASSFLPQDKKKYSKMAYLSTKNLNMYLSTMKESVESGSIVSASDAYSGVVHSCTHCHAITRSW